MASAWRALSLSALLLMATVGHCFAEERFRMPENLYIVHKDTGVPTLDEAAVQLHEPVERLDRVWGSAY
jgi:hypothetical protein